LELSDGGQPGQSHAQARAAVNSGIPRVTVFRHHGFRRYANYSLKLWSFSAEISGIDE
jgi:hypothetical protein